MLLRSSDSLGACWELITPQSVHVGVSAIGICYDGRKHSEGRVKLIWMATPSVNTGGGRRGIHMSV